MTASRVSRRSFPHRAGVGAISEDDVQRLRIAGFEDLAIHDACAIVAYFAFVNSIADGLGVELESHLR